MRHHCQGQSRFPQSTPAPVLSCIPMLTFRYTACLYNYTVEQTEFLFRSLEYKLVGTNRKATAVWGSVMKV